MEYRELGSTGLKVSAIGLGTWVMGGWMWGGANDRDSLAAIKEALDSGINLIDTAPIYGHGHAEKLVGQAVQESGRWDELVLASKVGLEWSSDKTKVWRHSSRHRVFYEVKESLRRLRTDCIDLYQVHWPDTATPFEETMEALLELQQQKKIRFIGVSNFDVPQLERCLRVGPVHSLQPPYNLFEREIEQAILPFCLDRRMGTLVYGPLCRGLLSGKYQGHEHFEAGDVRQVDPKFAQPCFGSYLACVARLQEVAQRRGKTVGQLAIRWCLDQPGVSVALCGARTPAQVRENAGAMGWSLSTTDQEDVERAVASMIQTPLGPEFMAPPLL